MTAPAGGRQDNRCSSRVRRIAAHFTRRPALFLKDEELATQDGQKLLLIVVMLADRFIRL